MLGCDLDDDGKEYTGMAFATCSIESVRIPSTLKVIEASTFSCCKNLKSIEFSEGLERIGIASFAGSCIESVILPASTKIIGAQAFAACTQLRAVRLNEDWRCWGRKRTSSGKCIPVRFSKKLLWRALRFRLR